MQSSFQEDHTDHEFATFTRALKKPNGATLLVDEDSYLLERDATVVSMLKPILRFLKSDGATELAINVPGKVFVEIGARFMEFDAPELTMTKLEALARCIATYTDQDISPRNPILSAMLPDGERIQIIVPPAVEPGCISMTIRVPSASIKPLSQYQEEGAFARYIWAEPPDQARQNSKLDRIDRELVSALTERDLMTFLRKAVGARKNIAVVGDTGSGKTTLMKSLCQEISTYERLITIEDVRELFLPNHSNRVHLIYSKGGQGIAKVTPADLISCCMRMKPDRVLLAELRGGEAFDFLKLLTTGHSGSITSYHAESCTLATERYVLMAKEHEQASIYNADDLKRLITLTMDVLIHVVAEVIYSPDGTPLRKERYVSEVRFDPLAKMRQRFGNAELHRGA